MGFSRQEYWNALPFPSPGDLPNPGIEPRSPALQADSLPAELGGKLGSYISTVFCPTNLLYQWASLLTQLVKNLPAMQETWVRFLGQEDPLEKEMATHSTILAWRIPMDRGNCQATVHGVARVRHDLATKPPPPHYCSNS